MCVGIEIINYIIQLKLVALRLLSLYNKKIYIIIIIICIYFALHPMNIHRVAIYIFETAFTFKERERVLLQ